MSRAGQQHAGSLWSMSMTMSGRVTGARDARHAVAGSARSDKPLPSERDRQLTRRPAPMHHQDGSGGDPKVTAVPSPMDSARPVRNMRTSTGRHRWCVYRPPAPAADFRASRRRTTGRSDRPPEPQTLGTRSKSSQDVVLLRYYVRQSDTTSTMEGRSPGFQTPAGASRLSPLGLRCRRDLTTIEKHNAVLTVLFDLGWG